MTRYLLTFLTLVLSAPMAWACTGITLKAKDGSVVVARTVEWALSDAQHNKVLVVPRNKRFQALTPEGQNGYVGVYYLPGFAEYATYDPADAENSMSVGDLMQWMLSSFKTVDELVAQLQSVKVVEVKNEDFGGADLPFHFKVADPSGASKIIEIVNNGEIKVYEPYLGVITNSPTYAWHVTNQRNYLRLSNLPNAPQNFSGYELKPLGGGSGLLGMPGDFTPPSRFTRAAAFTASCRPLENSLEAVLESFRILDNFNIPLGAQIPTEHIPKDISSATQVTTSSDLQNRVFYYHTMWNRQIRKIDLAAIDFATVDEQILDDDQSRSNNIKAIGPKG